MRRGFWHRTFFFPAETLPIADCSRIKKGPGVEARTKVTRGGNMLPLTKTGASTTIVQFIYGLFADTVPSLWLFAM
jgi:hypothetical protein